MIVEELLNNRLGIPIGGDDDNTTATIFIPKAGEGLINKEEDIFNKEPIFVTGIFAENEQLNICVFCFHHAVDGNECQTRIGVAGKHFGFVG